MTHVRALSKAAPVPAQSIEVILDIISQILGILDRIEDLFGVDFSKLFGKE